MRTLTFNRVIGTGAMGTVYHGELRAERGFSRSCAVKVMRATAPDQEHFRARMRDEARLLGMLQDEHILGVAELVRVEGRDCVIMEFVEGVDLQDLIKQRTVPPRALAELGAELAGTLHRAHSAKHPQTAEPLRVVHRDVKPANVMITSRGGVRLLDFGVARAAFASRESQTQGLVLGTLNYFPPEVLAGGEPTPSVDIYGLGLTLWECATGKEWGAPQVHRHRFERRCDQRLAELPPDYETILPVLKQILQWDPALRPDGGVVERAFLHAADTSSGEGLRTWARDVVPAILGRRDPNANRDELVGRTMPIEVGSEDLPPPLAVINPPPPRRSNPLETVTYNDLAPPAAVARAQLEAISIPPPAVRRDAARPSTQEEIRPLGAEKRPASREIARQPARATDRPPTAVAQRPRKKKKSAQAGLARNLALLVGAVLAGALIGGVVLVALMAVLGMLQMMDIIQLTG